jgi:hypothetical protein
MNDKVKKWLPWALVGMLLLGCCGGVPVAGVVVWLAWNEQPAAIVILPGNKAQAANQPPNDAWGYQKIQDRLANNGIKTTRTAGLYGSKVGMWFECGDKKTNPALLNDREASLVLGGNITRFFLEDHGTPAAAKEHVRLLADVQQQQATAWNKYVIYGNAPIRAAVKKALP